MSTMWSKCVIETTGNGRALQGRARSGLVRTHGMQPWWRYGATARAGVGPDLCWLLGSQFTTCISRVPGGGGSSNANSSCEGGMGCD